MHDHERVDPSTVRRGDQEVSTTTREVLLARRLHLEPEHAEEDEPGEKAQDAVQERRLRLRLAAQPRQALEGAVAATTGKDVRGQP